MGIKWYCFHYPFHHRMPFLGKMGISSDQPLAAQTEPLLQKHNKNQSYIGYHLSTDTDEPKSDDSSVSSVGLN